MQVGGSLAHCFFKPLIIVTTTTTTTFFFFLDFYCSDSGRFGNGGGGRGSSTHTSLLAHLLFLAVGVRGAGVEGGVVVAGRGVVGAGFAVFGRFGVDAVFVLRVFARVAERGGGREGAAVER